MEAFLLNPTVPAQQPVSQQGSATTGATAEGEFSPLLSEAVNTRKNDENMQGNSEQPDAPFVENENEMEQEINAENSNGHFPICATEPPLDKAVTVLAAATSDTPLSVKTALPAEIPAEPGKTTPQAANNSPSQRVVEKPETLLPRESQAPIAPQGSELTLTSTSKVENLLLQQIQQILDQGKDKGSITISGKTIPTPGNQNQTEMLRNVSNPMPAVADAATENGTIQARQIGVVVPATDDSTISSQKSVKLEGSPQDISQQYLHAKMGDSKNSSSENSNQNNNSQQKNFEAQIGTDTQTSANGNSGTTGADTKLVDSTFGQQPALSTNTSTSSSTIEGKLAPGAELPVPAKEMVSNLIQRFTSNPRLQTSKLTMQLHPAELGALKIDLLVKGDSIKANIVAQSQQVLETLEKYMPRLRNTLQDQGFTVDSFEISLEGESGNQKELFQEQFNSQQQEFAFTKSSSPQSESFDTFLESNSHPDITDSDDPGINLTV